MKGEDKYKIFKFKKGNLKLFGLFLVTAFVFLVLSKFSESYNRKIQLDVKLYNLEDEIVVADDSLAKATVSIKTKGFSLLQFLFNNTKTISLDVQKEVYKRNNQYYWDVKSNVYKLRDLFGSSVEVVGVQPDTIRINYYTLQTKKVPLKLISNLDFSPGYDIVGDINVSKDSVKIVGSNSIIDSVTYVKTEPLVLRDIRENIVEKISVETHPKYQIVPSEVEIKGKVSVFTEGQFSLPVELINIPKDKSINFFPKTVNLIYYVDVDNYKRTTAADFKVVADFNDVSNNQQQSVALKVVQSPSFVKKHRLQQSRIQFIISE